MSNQLKRILIDERWKAEKDIERLKQKCQEYNEDIDEYVKRINNIKNDINCLNNEIKRRKELITELDDILLTEKQGR